MSRSLFKLLIPLALFFFALRHFLGTRDIKTDVNVENTIFDSYNDIKSYGDPVEIESFDTTIYKPGFCVYYNYFKSDVSEKIGLALHSTPDLLIHLLRQLDTFNSTISLALYITYEIEEIHKIELLFNALEGLRWSYNTSKLSIHIVVSSRTQRCPLITYRKWAGHLIHNHNFVKLMFLDLTKIRSTSSIVYPINTLRNIARIPLRSRYFISGDIENIFSDNYLPFLNEHIDELMMNKVVLVHRRFEYDVDTIGDMVPNNFYTLKMLWRRRWVQEFHKIVNEKGHSIDGFAEWLRDGEDFGVQMEVMYNNSMWEPQFVARNVPNVPFHDESFIYRLRSNVEWAYELCRAGFRFRILKSVFTVHPGFKRVERSDFRELVQHTVQSGRLAQLTRAFRERLAVAYPAPHRCPTFAPEIE